MVSPTAPQRGALQEPANPNVVSANDKIPIRSKLLIELKTQPFSKHIQGPTTQSKKFVFGFVLCFGFFACLHSTLFLFFFFWFSSHRPYQQNSWMSYGHLSSPHTAPPPSPLHSPTKKKPAKRGAQPHVMNIT